MKATTLKINGTRIVPIDTVRFIKPLTDEDRTRAGDKLDIDASKSRPTLAWLTNRIVSSNSCA